MTQEEVKRGVTRVSPAFFGAILMEAEAPGLRADCRTGAPQVVGLCVPGPWQAEL